MQILQDLFGRKFSYLRLSVTDACNFKCTYCLPNGYQKIPDADSFLTIPEVKNLVRAFAEMGTWKIRITGGEPTLRRDLLQMIEVISHTPGIQKVSLSTNGYRLKALARLLREAGI